MRVRVLSLVLGFAAVWCLAPRIARADQPGADHKLTLPGLHRAFPNALSAGAAQERRIAHLPCKPSSRRYGRPERRRPASRCASLPTADWLDWNTGMHAHPAAANRLERYAALCCFLPRAKVGKDLQSFGRVRRE
jgi:hypothetical protein